jgi:hypothetical protein
MNWLSFGKSSPELPEKARPFTIALQKGWRGLQPGRNIAEIPGEFGF